MTPKDIRPLLKRVAAGEDYLAALLSTPIVVPALVPAPRRLVKADR